jgi:phage I-like protein
MPEPIRTALCAALALPSSEGAPDWIHLLPAGEIATVDSRGPYKLTNAAALAAASLQAAGGRMPIDENHATDLAAPKGGPSPARGWRDDAERAGGAGVAWRCAGRLP